MTTIIPHRAPLKPAELDRLADDLEEQAVPNGRKYKQCCGRAATVH